MIDFIDYSMGLPFGPNLVQRDFITSKVSSFGLFHALPKVPTITYDDSFCRIVRDTDNIEIEKVLHWRTTGNLDELQQMATLVDMPFKPKTATVSQCVEIIIMFHVLGAGFRMDRALSRMLWQGNPINNTESGSYREFKGFELLVGEGREIDIVDIDEALSDIPALAGIEFMLVACPLLINTLLTQESHDFYKVGDREFRLVRDISIPESAPKLDEFVSSLYVIPVSAADEEEPITYLEYADYRDSATSLLVDNSMFWTDNGFYIWKMEQEKWDAKLSIKNESRLIMRRPELALRFNLRYRPESLR